jgi:hypothetical protein
MQYSWATEKKHTSLNLMKLLGLDASYIMMKK